MNSLSKKKNSYAEVDSLIIQGNKNLAGKRQWGSREMAGRTKEKLGRSCFSIVYIISNWFIVYSISGR